MSLPQIGSYLVAIAALLLPAGRLLADPPKVYAIIVIDTKSNLTADVKRDANTMKKALADNIPANRLKFVILDDAAASFKSIKDELKKVPEGTDDTLIVMVSSHGKSQAKDADAHILELSGENANKSEEVLRRDLRQAMLAKKLRLTILITDACSNCPNSAAPPPPPVKDIDLTLAGPPDGKIPVGINRLFFEAKGVVDLNATGEGTFAWSDPLRGGVFMRSFGRVLGNRYAITADTLAAMRNANVPDAVVNKLKPIQSRKDVLFSEEEVLVELAQILEAKDVTAWKEKILKSAFQENLTQDRELTWVKLHVQLKKDTETTFKDFRKQTLDDFEREAIARPGGLTPREARTVDFLKKQSAQAPQAYYLPGVRLGIDVTSTGGNGVRVTNLTLESPLRKAGVKVDDIILAVDGESTPTTGALAAAVAGKAQFSLKVKTGDAQPRVLSVDVVSP